MLINKGDEIKNWQGYTVTITKAKVGRYGILFKGLFDDGGNYYEAYCPCEMEIPSKPMTLRWPRPGRL